MSGMENYFNQLALIWPWHSEVDPFWKSLWASAAIIIPTVAIAVWFELWRRQESARRVRAEQREIFHALLASLFRELVTNLSWVETFQRHASETVSTGVLADQLTHRTTTSLWDSQRWRFIELGIPRNLYHDIDSAYFNLSSVVYYSELIASLGSDRRILYALGSNNPEKEEVLTFSFAEPIAKECATRHTIARDSFLRFAKEHDIELEVAFADVKHAQSAEKSARLAREEEVVRGV